MKKQETFEFARADESQKNAIVILKEADEDSFNSLLWVLRARSKDDERPLFVASIRTAKGNLLPLMATGCTLRRYRI
jgi:hypothetical protein